MIELLLSDAAGWTEALLSGLLLFALRATVVLLAAWGATYLLRRGSAATRHLVWTAAVTAVLVLPLLSIALPRWNVPVVDITANLDAPLDGATRQPAIAREADPRPAATREPKAPASSAQVEHFSEVAAAAPSAWSLPHLSIEPRDVVVAAWLTIVVLLVLRLAIANARVLSWKRASRLVEDARWNALLRRLTREHDIERPVVLLESPETDVPVTWGIVYPVVLIPSASIEWDEEQRIAVLTHELAHVKRFDALSQMLAQLALALLWFHPLAWLAVRRMRMEREHACDDFVLVAGARASRYADDLLGLARRLARPTAPAAAALAMARRSELEGRLLAILDPTAKRNAIRGARAAALTATMIALTMPIAAFSPGARIVTQTRAAASNVERTAVAAAPESPVTRPDVALQGPATRPATPAAPATSVPAADSPMRITLDSLLGTPATFAGLPQRTPMIGRVMAAPLRLKGDTEPVNPVDAATLVEVSRAAKRMSSDYEKGQLLAQVAKRYVRNDTLRDAYLDAVFTMSSDVEKGKALTALLERDSIPASHTAKVLRAAKQMSSDQSRGAVLRKISLATFADTAVQQAYVDVISAMTSDTERSTAITPMLKQQGLSQGIQLSLLRAIGLMTTSTEKANALIGFQTQQGTTDPVVRRAFLKSAESLTSDTDYRRVMMALMR